MEFDKSKVYTALNADELKVGSKVIVSDNLELLKSYVEKEDECQTGYLEEVNSESQKFRFYVNGSNWNLAYLLEEPEEKKLKWTDLKLGDIVHKKNTHLQGIVTMIDECIESDIHILIGGVWRDDRELELWEKVE